MPRNIDHVIGARHDIKIPILIDHPGVAGLVIAWEGCKVAFAKPIFGIPEGWQCAGGQRQFDCDRAQCAGRLTVACFV